MRLKVILSFLALFAVASSVPMSPHSDLVDDTLPLAPFAEIDGKDYRLPNNTRPVHYTVSLTTDIDKGESGQSFSGKVRIRIEAVETTNEITLHYRQITIENIAIYSTGTPSVLIQDNINHVFSEDVEFLIIRPISELTASTQYFVDITYQGLLRDDNMGFYRSSYKNEHGQTVWLATTQFESTDARHAFPCYDEPQIRTPFIIEIKHDKSYSAISNWPVDTETPEEGTDYTFTKFQETFPVQTYLIAFVVSDFKYVESNDPIKQRVFAKPQSIANHEGDLALDAGKRILDKFIEHLGVSYNPPKLDQIALPDFDAGAMENWGLVTYREEYLLFNEEIGTTRQRENILTIISHEYAHQWFGNHVSPNFWTYIWLNEGFATLYADYLTSLVYPEDRLMDLFVVDTVQPVLETDANPSIRAMTQYVESPERISSLFDRIAYSKSGSVLRMMQVALGVSTWTKGLRYYINDMEYKSASASDLYRGLQRAVDEDYPEGEDYPERPDVAAIMTSWETQAGVPVIYVTRNPSNQIEISQRRFYYTDDQSTTRWHVPINYVVGSNPDFTESKPDVWLDPSRQVLRLQGSTAQKPWTIDDWILLNIQETGYYRVNYDVNLWSLLIEQLHGSDFNRIHVLNRAQLVDDSLNLARAGLLFYDTPFEILSYLKNEFDYAPWAAANRGLTLLNRWLTGSSAYDNYQKFVRKIVGPLYNKLGVEIEDDDPKLDRYGRALAINLACQAGLPACLSQTAAKLQEVVTSDAKIAPDLQSAIYCNGLRQTNAATFSFLQSKMLSSEDQAERTLIINALGCAQDESTLTNYLNLAIQPGNNLRLQEKFRVLVAPVNNGELGLRVMMSFITANHESIKQVTPTQVDVMLSNIAPRVASQELNDAFNTMLDALEAASAITSTSSEVYKATANSNLEWQEKNLEKIQLWLWLDDGNVAPTDAPTTIAATDAPTTAPPEEDTTLGAGSIVVSTFAVAACALIKYFL